VLDGQQVLGTAVRASELDHIHGHEAENHLVVLVEQLCHAHVGENPAKCPFADVVAGMYWHGSARPSGWRMM
jgi:hypothetical protein